MDTKIRSYKVIQMHILGKMISTSLTSPLFALRQKPSTKLPTDFRVGKNSFEDHLEVGGAWHYCNCLNIYQGLFWEGDLKAFEKFSCARNLCEILKAFPLTLLNATYFYNYLTRGGAQSSSPLKSTKNQGLRVPCFTLKP